MDCKKEIRRKLRIKLAGISDKEYLERSETIASHLFAHESWIKAKTIGVTISKKPEVNTWPIIEKAWQEGKTVSVPKCDPDQRRMTFRKLTTASQLESVYSGLLEPIEAETQEVQKDQIDLLLVPGLGYTASGFRIGFGGGYYDRFLQEYKGRTVSLAFSIQLLDELPLEPHDLPVGLLITEEGRVTM